MWEEILAGAVVLILGIIITGLIRFGSLKRDIEVNAKLQEESRTRMDNFQEKITEEIRKHEADPSPHTACAVHSIDLSHLTRGVQEIKSSIEKLNDNFTQFMIDHAKGKNGSNGHG